jgi:chromosomal replication initiation ATPase DnaA
MIKRKTFDMYFKEVSDAFGIDILSNTRERDYTDARFVLYYLCRENNMRLKQIQEYLSDLGFSVSHTNIVYGHSHVSSLINKDEEMKQLVDSIRNV